MYRNGCICIESDYLIRSALCRLPEREGIVCSVRTFHATIHLISMLLLPLSATFTLEKLLLSNITKFELLLSSVIKLAMN